MKNSFLPRKSERTAKKILVSWKIMGREANINPIVAISIFLSLIANGSTIDKTPLMKEFKT